MVFKRVSSTSSTSVGAAVGSCCDGAVTSCPEAMQSFILTSSTFSILHIELRIIPAAELANGSHKLMFIVSKVLCPEHKKTQDF